MFKRILETWGNCLVIVLGIAFALHLILFRIVGWLLIGEDNMTIWGIELVVALLIILLGVLLMKWDVQAWRRRRK